MDVEKKYFNRAAYDDIKNNWTLMKSDNSSWRGGI